jgi:hypothetical protein
MVQGKAVSSPGQHREGFIFETVVFSSMIRRVELVESQVSL